MVLGVGQAGKIQINLNLRAFSAYLVRRSFVKFRYLAPSYRDAVKFRCLSADKINLSRAINFKSSAGKF